MSADPGTLAWLRDRNDRTALALLLEHGPLSRAQLAQLTGMSKPSAAKMIARLEQVGLAEPVGESPGARGPNAVLYGVPASAKIGVAISVQSDAIEAVVVDPVGGVYPVAVVPVGQQARTPEGDVAAAVAAACARAGLDPVEVSAVAVGLQAAVDDALDEITFTNTLPGWPRSGARARIEQATGFEVILDNDVTLATLAERASGAFEDESSFVLIWLGDGLGAGLDVDGVVQRGRSGGAGEVGYLEVPRSAARLDPNARDFTDLLGHLGVVRLLGLAGNGGLVDMLPAGLDGHPALDELADRVALLVAPVVAINDPGLVVLGGPTGVSGGAALARLVEERLRATDELREDASHSPRTRIRPAAVTSRPVLTGAARLLVAHIRDALDDLVASDRPEGATSPASSGTGRNYA